MSPQIYSSTRSEPSPAWSIDIDSKTMVFDTDRLFRESHLTASPPCPTCRHHLDVHSITHHFLRRTCTACATTIYSRHDSYVKMLTMFLRRCGATVTIEPMTRSMTQAHTGQERGDLHVVFPPGRHRPKDAVIDVSFTSPEQKTTIANAPTIPLAAAAHRERTKSARYRSLNSNRDLRFVPFILETTGAIGRRAQSYISEVVNFVQHRAQGLPMGAISATFSLIEDFPDDHQGLIPYFRALSAAEVARGNARILESAYQQLWRRLSPSTETARRPPSSSRRVTIAEFSTYQPLPHEDAGELLSRFHYPLLPHDDPYVDHSVAPSQRRHSAVHRATSFSPNSFVSLLARHCTSSRSGSTSQGDSISTSAESYSPNLLEDSSNQLPE